MARLIQINAGGAPRILASSLSFGGGFPMSAAEKAYLAMSIAAAVIFMATLAWASWRSG